MANWYSNGNEIPEDKKEAIEFLNDRVNKSRYVCYNKSNTINEWM